MEFEETINWLLNGDVSIQYQVHRDLLQTDRPDLRMRISKEGWGSRFLAQRNADGHWGKKFYQPKWTSTHYTLLDLKCLQIDPMLKEIRESISLIIKQEKGVDGGIDPSREINKSDVCLNGMFLNYACYFGASEPDLVSVIDFILSQRMPDGGFNCRKNRSGARHSSLHSSLSVLEGIFEYISQGYTYRLNELLEAQQAAEEFILKHQLYISDRTGEIIKPEFLRLSYPSRWRYNILRALEYFRQTEAAFDQRMEPALHVLLKKRRKDNRWNLQAKHAGQTHFDMEVAGKASRWNTLRALSVLIHFGI
jgi:hypothetical protein